MGELTDRERIALDDALVDSGCHGFQGDHPDLYVAVERIVAAHVARATADAEIVRAEWERQYDYAAEAAERFRKQAVAAEARLAAVSEAVEPVDPPMGTRDALASRDGAFVVQRVLAALDSAPTTDADGRDERRDGAGGSPHMPGCERFPTGWLCVSDCTTVWHEGGTP